MYDKYINMESGFDMYMNSGYNNNRNRKKTLIVDFDDNDNTHLGSGTEFKIDLREPLIIDKHSEVYLDNFLTFNCNLGDTHNRSAFVLKINEFNIHSGVASNSSSDKIDRCIVIPNDNNNIENYFGQVVHKGKKFNYICDINPQKLHSISGKITDLNGDPMFHGSSTGTKFTYALTGISGWTTNSGTAQYLPEGAVFTQITTSGGTNCGPGTILTNTALSANTIFFTSASVLDPVHYDAGATIQFTMNSDTGDYVFTLTGDGNSIALLKQNARFISEFSIVSRDK